VASVAADGLIGLWGEWSGDTKGHEYNRLQVIQLATEKCSVVFKVGTWKHLPQAALELFTHPRLRTVALGGQEITKKLRKDFKVDVTNGIDVLDLPAAQRCQPRSLKGLVGVFLQWNVGMDQAGKTNALFALFAPSHLALVFLQGRSGTRRASRPAS
jgi:hypothetical protein